MTAFVVFQTTVLDPEKAAAYARAALPILAAQGGTKLAIGPLGDLHGSSAFDHGALFSFADRAAAEAWYNGPEYQALVPLRTEAMRCSVVLVG